MQDACNNNTNKLQYSVHPAIGKNTNNTNLAQGWMVRSSDRLATAEAYLTERGNAFSWGTFEGGHRRMSNLIRLDGIGLDIDNDGKSAGYLTWQQAMADPILGQAWLCYPSPSFRPDRHRFRLLFKLPEPVFTRDQFHEVKSILLQLMDLYPTVDKACKDPCRLWYGNPGSLTLFSNPGEGVVPVEQIAEAHAQWVEANPKAIKSSLALNLNKHSIVGADNNEGFCPAFDGYFRNDPALVEFIMAKRLVLPFAGRQTDTYQDARPFLYASTAWVGPETVLKAADAADWTWDNEPIDREVERILDDLDVETKPFAALFNGALKWRVQSSLCDLTWNHVNQFSRGGKRYGRD